MAKSSQVDPMEEAIGSTDGSPAKQDAMYAASRGAGKGSAAAPAAPAPAAPGPFVAPPPRFKLKMSEKQLVGVGGRMTWVHPGMIVSEHTHSKNFLEGLKQKGIEMEQLPPEEKSKSGK